MLLTLIVVMVWGPGYLDLRVRVQVSIVEALTTQNHNCDSFIETLNTHRILWRLRARGTIWLAGGGGSFSLAPISFGTSLLNFRAPTWEPDGATPRFQDT